MDIDKEKYSKALGDDLEFLLGLSPAKPVKEVNTDVDFTDILEFSKIVNELEDLLSPESSSNPVNTSSPTVELSEFSEVKENSENKISIDEIEAEADEEEREEREVQNSSISFTTPPKDLTEKLSEPEKASEPSIETNQAPEEYISLFDLNNHSDSESIEISGSKEKEKPISSSTFTVKSLPRPRRPSSSHISILSDPRLRGDFSLQYEPPASPYQYIGLEPADITHFVARSAEEYNHNYSQAVAFSAGSLPTTSITSSFGTASNSLSHINDALLNQSLKLNDYFSLFPTLSQIKSMSSLSSASNSTPHTPISSSVVVHFYECVIRPDVSSHIIMSSLLGFLKKVLKFKVVDKIEEKEEKRLNYNHFVVSRTRETTILLKTQASSLNYQAFASFFPSTTSSIAPTTSASYNKEWDTIDIQFALSPNMKQRVLVFQFIKKIEIISSQLSQQYLSGSNAPAPVSSSSSFSLVTSLTTIPSTLTFQLLYMISDTLIKNYFTFSTLYHVSLLQCCQCVFDTNTGEYLELKDESSSGESEPKNILSLTEELTDEKESLKKYSQQLVLINSSLHTFIPLSPLLSTPQYYRGFDPHFLFHVYYYSHTISQKTNCYNDFRYMIDYLNEEEKKMKGVISLFHSMLGTYNILTLSEKFDKESDWKRQEEYEKHDKLIRNSDESEKDLNYISGDPLSTSSSTFFPVPLLRIQTTIPGTFLSILKKKLINSTPSLSTILNNFKFNEENDSISLILSLNNHIFSNFLLDCDKIYTQEIQKVNFLIVSLIESIKQHQLKILNMILNTQNIYDCELMKSFSQLFSADFEVKSAVIREDSSVAQPIKTWFSSFFSKDTTIEEKKTPPKINESFQKNYLEPEVNELVLYYCNCLIGKVMGKLFITQLAIYFSPYSFFASSPFFSSINSSSTSVPSSSTSSTSSGLFSGISKFRVELNKIDNILVGDEIKSISPNLTVNSSSPISQLNENDEIDNEEIEINFSSSKSSSFSPTTSVTSTTIVPSSSSFVEEHSNVRTSSTSSSVVPPPTIYSHHSIYFSIESLNSVQFTLIATNPNELKNLIVLLKSINLD